MTTVRSQQRMTAQYSLSCSPPPQRRMCCIMNPLLGQRKLMPTITNLPIVEQRAPNQNASRSAGRVNSGHSAVSGPMVSPEGWQERDSGLISGDLQRPGCLGRTLAEPWIRAGQASSHNQESGFDTVPRIKSGSRRLSAGVLTGTVHRDQ
jgi:hypothetical protein